MYTTAHAKIRFLERVNCDGLPKRHKNKYIEAYLKTAYKDGLTPNEIEDRYLREYMINKLHNDSHYSNITKIVHYKNNLFLFHNRQCITILEVPEKAEDSVDNIIYINKLHPFINKLKEKSNVKKWLHDHGKHIENIKIMKRCIVTYPLKLNYEYIMNKFPVRAISYIKNDSQLRKVIIKTNKKRNGKTKELYYFICALLLIFPKNQILKLQQALKNNKESIFNIKVNGEITEKQLHLCYKQLFILLGCEPIAIYKRFKVKDNLCFDLINDHLNNIIDSYILEIQKLFKSQ